MANTNEKVRVLNALIQLGLAGPFYAVTYDKATKLANDIDEATAPSITPAHVASNEISSGFEVDSRRGGHYAQQRVGWTWLLVVTFNQEVTSHRAEEDWMETPLVLPKTADFPGTVTLLLGPINYVHPTKQQPSSGSRLEYSFEALVSRK